MDSLIFERDDVQEMRQAGLDLIYNPYDSMCPDIDDIMKTREPVRVIAIQPCYKYRDYIINLTLKACKYDSKNRTYIDLDAREITENIVNNLGNASSLPNRASFPSTLYNLDNIKDLCIRNRSLVSTYNVLRQEYDSYYNEGGLIPGSVKDLKREMLEYIVLRNIVNSSAFPENNKTTLWIDPLSDTIIFTLPRNGNEQRYYLSQICITDV